MKRTEQRILEVWADWAELNGPRPMGILHVTPGRDKEIFAFEYDKLWLRTHSRTLDPSLQLYSGPQYPSRDKTNFGLFLDSCPDRWGRFLMDRREAYMSRREGRPSRTLHESDYLLGVYDGHRMGALRFRTEPNGPFLDDNATFACPPWTKLRDLEDVSLQLENPGADKSGDYEKWLSMLVAPGSSLGGARPKAGVLDERQRLWIAKFPSRKDTYDLGAWEYVVSLLGRNAGIVAAESLAQTFSTDRHTFLTRRFDRDNLGRRVHFASALTLLGYSDGADSAAGVSYLELAEFIVRFGARPDEDLAQLWRRIVFSLCVANSDDHLRNHGFLLEADGWSLSPAFDINPNPKARGLTLNITDSDNALDLDLAMEVCDFFRVKPAEARSMIGQVARAVDQWRTIASSIGISSMEQDLMEGAFRLAASWK